MWQMPWGACRKTTCIAPAWRLIPWEKPLPIITGGLLLRVQAVPPEKAHRGSRNRSSRTNITHGVGNQVPSSASRFNKR